jgi:RNA polymerase sigma-70 factor (ECF subfamily)
MEQVAPVRIDPALAAAAVAGDPRARERLLADAHRLALRYQLKLFSGAREAALDAAQDTMLRAVAALDSLRDPARFVPWLLRIATNVWRDHHRRATPPVPRPRVVRELPDAVLRILDAVRALPEPYRIAVTLRYLESLDYDVMAEVLDVPSGTLRSHVARGLRMLRERLGDAHAL